MPLSLAAARRRTSPAAPRQGQADPFRRSWRPSGAPTYVGIVGRLVAVFASVIYHVWLARVDRQEAQFARGVSGCVVVQGERCSAEDGQRQRLFRTTNAGRDSRESGCERGFSHQPVVCALRWLCSERRMREGIPASPGARGDSRTSRCVRTAGTEPGRYVWTVGGSAVQSSRWDSGCVWRSGFPGPRPGLRSGRAYGTQAGLTGFPGRRPGLRSGRAYGTQGRLNGQVVKALNGQGGGSCQRSAFSHQDGSEKEGAAGPDATWPSGTETRRYVMASGTLRLRSGQAPT